MPRQKRKRVIAKMKAAKRWQYDVENQNIAVNDTSTSDIENLQRNSFRCAKQESMFISHIILMICLNVQSM